MNMQRPIIMLVPLTLLLLLGMLIPGEAMGASVVLDDSMITYTPEEPKITDEFNITVEPLLIEAEPVDGGVVLMWSLCTDAGCGVAQPKQMEDNGDGTWSAVLGGPFPEKDPGNDLPHKDILFYVKVTAVPTAGGAEFSEQSDPITVYFNDTVPADDDDDDDTSDDDDDDDDSPVGPAVVIFGILIAVGVAVYKRRK